MECKIKGRNKKTSRRRKKTSRRRNKGMMAEIIILDAAQKPASKVSKAA